jgi:O-antigen/teichoic acid export membrane protein
VATDSIKRFALTGVRWLALKSLVGEVLGISSTVILARLVSPSEFGHAAVALLFVLLAVILTFEGPAAALVQRASVNERHRQVSVLLSLVLGTFLCGVVLLFVPLVWRPVFGGETADLIAITAPTFIIASVGTVSRATLWRDLNFRRMAIVDLTSGLAGNIVSVALALMGLGAKAIVIGSMSWIAANSLLLLLSAHEPLPRWHAREAREIGHYGFPAALAGLVTQLFNNVDYWILAARLSPFQTGIYYRAFNTGVVYQGKVSNVMMQLAFPVYSRMEDREQVRRLHERAARIHAVVIFPFLALLIALAPVAVPFVFGSVWRPAVGPSEILAGAGMCAALLTGYPQVMMAVGRPRTLLRFNLAMLVLYGSAIAIAVGYGLIAVATAVVTVYLLMLIGAYHFLLRPHLGLSLLSLLSELRPAVVSCLILIAVSEPLRIALTAPLSPAPTLVLVGALGLGAYALSLRFLFPSTWRETTSLLLSTLPSVITPRRREAAPPNPEPAPYPESHPSAEYAATP